MAQEFDMVHLLTYKQFGQVDIENCRKSFSVLNERFPGKFIHVLTDVSEMFLKIYNRRYVRNLIKYRTLQLQFACFACHKYRTLQLQFACFACHACFHIYTIIYCVKNKIFDVRDGANTEYEEASPMQIKTVRREIKKLYATYGINHDSPVYEEYKTNRSDYQLYELGLRPQPNIKDDEGLYKAYQGYCRFMPGGVVFLNYQKRCNSFPEKVQLKMREHWLEEVEFFKSLINERIS